MGTNWEGRIFWKPHVDKEGRPYPLHHLNPLDRTLVLPAQGKHQETTVTLYISFSLHTFTHTIMGDDDSADDYSDNRECRAFDYERYAASQRLPKIAREIETRQIHFATSKSGRINYVTVEMEDNSTYTAFFSMRRWKEQGENAVQIVFESAYPLGPENADPRGGRISFRALLGHTLRGTTPRPPP